MPRSSSSRSWRAAPRRRHATPWLELLCAGDALAPELAGIGQTLARWRQLVRRLPPHDALDAICQQGDVLARYGAACRRRCAMRAGQPARAARRALQLDGGRYARPMRSCVPCAPRACAARPSATPRPCGCSRCTAPRAWKPPSCCCSTPTPVRRGPRPWACWSTGGLYVATTRARERLVLSSVRPARANESSWWSRLEPLCEPTEAGEPLVALPTEMGGGQLLDEANAHSACHC
jgi:ATP-dependent helicase/nuclease subunit A